MKKTMVTSLFLLLAAGAVLAMSSANYYSPMSIVGAGGGNSVSASYANTSAIGAAAVGKSVSASYIGISGGLGITVYSGDLIPPMISNAKIDGKTTIANDYIKSDGTLTALVTDETAIDLNASSVEVDGTGTTFAALTGSSSYNATTGVLTFKFNLTTNGNHSYSIRAVDSSGNTTIAAQTVKTDTGDLKATSVYMYPNPFNPNNGAGAIAYQLSKDGDTSIYIFNSVGQLIYKRSYVAGQPGAQAGYNEVAWDGKSDFGTVLGNDIYFLRVVSGGKPIGRTKIAVIK
ncbi:MAG TPA: hypothetical protein VMD02_03300 [Candidatus Omnitrophota bacterium]|nr:hypothetical protein [Candidatus Omnitrophota bacterium]